MRTTTLICVPIIHGPPGDSSRSRGSNRVPNELFLWTAERSRWAGTPADVRSLARRLIEEVTQDQAVGTTTIINLSIDIPDRSWGTDTPERLEEDLRVHRSAVRSVRLDVLVVAHGQIVSDIKSVRTNEWTAPMGWHMETPSPPVHAAFTLSRDAGARLEVRSATGINGERIFNALLPFLTNGVRWNAPRGILVGPVAWLFPRLEITAAGRPHWRALGATLVATLGLLGALSGIAAVAKAGFQAIFGGHDRQNPTTCSVNTTQGAAATRLFVSNEGQIAGGEIFGVPQRGGGIVNTTNASVGSAVRLWLMIYDPGPGFLSNVRIRVALPTAQSDYADLTAYISSINAQPASTTASATLNVGDGQKGCVEYVPGSTQVTKVGGAPVRLPDGIVQGGISVGDVEPGPKNTLLVSFRAKVVDPRAQRG